MTLAGSTGYPSGAAPRPTGRTPRAIAGIALIALLVSILAALTTATSPLFDPDEGYYPATASETLRSGTFWDLRFNGAPRWDKPVLAYALIEGAFRLFGESAGAARLPSVLEGAALIAIAGLLVRRLAGGRAGVLAALVIGTTLGLAIFMRAAHPEIAIVLSVVTTELLLCVWLTASSDAARWRTAAAIGVSLAYGLLAKGPVAIVLPMLALACALPFIAPVLRQRQWPLRTVAAHAALAGLLAILLAGPWYAAMAARHGGAFLRESLWQQNVGRYTTGVYRHQASPFFLFLPALAGLFPWTGLLPFALGRLRGCRDACDTRDLLRTFMTIAAATALVFYSCSSSKLASYALVCIPPLGIVVALWLDEALGDPRHLRGGWTSTVALLGLLAVGLIGASALLPQAVLAKHLLGGLRPSSADLGLLLAPIGVVVGGLFGAGALILARLRSAGGRIATLAAVGVVAPVLLLITARPLLREMYPWDRFGPALVHRPAAVWLLGRRAPSLIFYAHQPVRIMADRAQLEAAFGHESSGWLALTSDDWASVSQASSLRDKRCAPAETGGRMVLVWCAGRAETTAMRVGSEGDPRR